MMGAASQYHGSVIAFEGPPDTVTTQLRLLPNSPNILIIPPLEQFMKEENPKAPFNARSRILAVHKACNDRIEVAREFLRDSTPSNKRLVFMNGGTASAQIKCLNDISQHLTNGDITRAEQIFNRLVRNGAAGLHRWRKIDTDSRPSLAVVANDQPTEPDEETPTSDPTSEAMRAAEALDLETAFLQPNNEIDLTTATRSRSMSVPAYQMVDDFQNIAPFYLFGARKGQRREIHDLDISQSPHRSYTTQDSRKKTRRSFSLTRSRKAKKVCQPTSPSCSGDEHSKNEATPMLVDMPSPRSFGFASTPTTPAICQALAIDIRHSASTASQRKVKAVDRIYASAIRNQDILLCSFPEPPRSRPQLPDSSPKPIVRSKFFSEIPRPTFSTPNRTTARRGPPSPLNLGKSLPRPGSYVDHGTNPRSSYVDRGTSMEPEPIYVVDETDTVDSSSLSLEESFQFDPYEPFEAVLPMLENLVLLFKGEKPDTQLEATIDAFREGTYPICRSTSEPEAKAGLGQPGTPNSRGSQMALRKSNVQHAEVSPSYHMDPNEYDPFACGKYLRPPRAWQSKQNGHSHRPSTPPTPAQTPPLTERTTEKCFHDFTTTNCRTAVSMQNSLRSILNIYFPPEDAGYHQFNFPLLPELSSLWKPVFREADSGTVKKRRRKVDLILAIGAQKGVDKEFLGAISGSLEKLGTKPNGISRSGRLDLRYLIASAMQAFTSQPLTSQTHDNPFTNPLLLATLIIPHLETYMAAHSAARFLLLEYPPEHLTSVLALQRLVGADLLKVVGVLDAEIDEPKQYPPTKIPTRTHTHTRTNTKSSVLSTGNTKAGATLLTPTGAKQGETPSFSKANYLLVSSANESEISTLISTIWKILIDISTFYIPEGVASKTSIQVDRESKRGSKSESQGRALAQTPLINTTQQYAPLTNAALLMGFQKQQAGAGDTSSDFLSDGTHTGTDMPPRIPSKHRRRKSAQVQKEALLKSSKGSISETIRSSRTVQTMRSQRHKLRNMLGREGREADADSTFARVDSGSVYQDYFDEDEDDDGFAAEERKYMPLYGRRLGPQKGSSRKALKWLGLAI